MRTTERVVPTVANGSSEELVLTVEIGEENFEFLVDTGACVSLIQPGVGSGLSDGSQYLVRGVTGSELKVKGLRCLRFQLGTRTYEHTFLVARIATKSHGIMGLDSLKALKAVIDVGRSRIRIGKENYPLTSRECYEEGNSFWVKIEHDGKTAKTVETKPLSGDKYDGEPRDSNSRVEQRGEPREEIYGIMSSSITIPARTTVIAKVNLETKGKVRVETGNMPPTILLESTAMLIPGVYMGRALSRVYDNKEFRSQERPKRRIAERDETQSDLRTRNRECLLYSEVTRLAKPDRQEMLDKSGKRPVTSARVMPVQSFQW
jgi:hypothetical protein